VETRHAFVGDQSGQVTILKLEQESCSLVTTFKGHTGTHTHLDLKIEVASKTAVCVCVCVCVCVQVM